MRVHSQKRVIGAAVLAVLAAVPYVPITMAQQGVLEEVVVTSRKRTENLQDVGFAVSALTKREIEGQFARDITDLANISPNIVIDDTAQGDQQCHLLEPMVVTKCHICKEYGDTDVRNHLFMLPFPFGCHALIFLCRFAGAAVTAKLF